MKLSPTDCKNCFKYNDCLNGLNNHCIIFNETLEPFTMIKETCIAFNEECDKCPIKKDCYKYYLDHCSPSGWYECN